MSEEKNEQPEVIIGFAAAGDKIDIVFADGSRRIPDYVVEYLGKENLEKLAPLLINKTFDEFLGGFHQKVHKDSLNALQQTFVNNHFSRF